MKIIQGVFHKTYKTEGGIYYSSPSINSDGTLYIGVYKSSLDKSDIYAFAPVTLALTFPNGGEELVAGTKRYITWTSTGTANVKLEYSTDGGATWKTISSIVNAATGSYQWTVPSVASKTCRVRITSNEIPSVTDQSEGAFTIIVPGVTLTSPNGGEKWIAGRTGTVAWKSSGVTQVKLEYSKDNGATWILIAGAVNAADSAYVWTIPDTPSAQCLVRITDTASAARKDVSNAVFTILPLPYLRLTAPNGGESWRTTATEYITWESQSIERVRIEFTLNGGADWTVLAAGAEAAPDTLAWTLPGEVSTACRVRISDVADPALADTSDANFSILAHNVNAGFAVDADLEHAGYQGPDRIGGIGGGKNVGFALYAKEWDAAGGFTVTFSWNPDRASFRSSTSSPNITDDERTINGKTFTPAPETNILGGALLSVEENSPGFYTRSFAIMGGGIPITPGGLIYFAVFRTSAAFTERDTLSIRTTVKLADENGMEKDLGVRFFSIGAGLQPPSNLVVSDVPDDQGHSLRLTWTASPSEQGGLVSFYRIYRSLSATMTEPKPLNMFKTLEQLNAAEKMYTILVDSVAAGKAEYIDNCVGISGALYYYWIQAVGMDGASKPVMSTTPTGVADAMKVPREFRLGAAFPNPFNPSTAIEYALPKDAFVTLVVYNITGQRVATLLEKPQSAGRYSAVWDARGLPSGIYIYTLRAGEFTGTGKATLLK